MLLVCLKALTLPWYASEGGCRYISPSELVEFVGSEPQQVVPVEQCLHLRGCQGHRNALSSDSLARQFHRLQRTLFVGEQSSHLSPSELVDHHFAVVAVCVIRKNLVTRASKMMLTRGALPIPEAMGVDQFVPSSETVT